jgi:hypothetical protein
MFHRRKPLSLAAFVFGGVCIQHGNRTTVIVEVEMVCRPVLLSAIILSVISAPVFGATGDPQVGTDHPWYSGELSCSTWERLFANQAQIYQRVKGKLPETEEEKALASWMWRNIHFWHGEEGVEDLWSAGFNKGGAPETRDYWKGLFADGFGLCFSSHEQWIAEMNMLLGHGRSRGCGVIGHHTFEVWLTGGEYKDGKWALLDHDISTVIYDLEGKALLSIEEIQKDLDRLIDRDFKTERQQGWPMSPYLAKHGAGYAKFDGQMPLSGYATNPPLVHLRRGETLRRYLKPGLSDGKTFVFWGRNYNEEGIPGPHRWASWVDRPEQFFGGKGKPGQAWYANAVYTYAPDFSSADYKEGVIDESDNHVTFEFYTPYIIACTPADKAEWGIYNTGAKNGLVLSGKAACPVSVSIDQGKTWQDCGTFSEGLDITDRVKGHRQYFIRFGVAAKALAGSSLKMTTVCQCSSWIIPRLKDGGTKISFASSGKAVLSAGPCLAQAKAHLVDGAFGSPAFTLEVKTPRKESIAAIYPAAQVLSYTTPNQNVKYQIEYSVDGGTTWAPVVKDWSIKHFGFQPKQHWSQSFVWGNVDLKPGSNSVRIRFSNSGGIQFMRGEAHIVYSIPAQDPTKVTFGWRDEAGERSESHVFRPGDKSEPWDLATGKSVLTRWVELAPAPVK